MSVHYTVASGTMQRPEKRVQVAPDQWQAHHSILVIGFDVGGDRDIGERQQQGADYSSEQKEKLTHIEKIALPGGKRLAGAPARVDQDLIAFL